MRSETQPSASSFRDRVIVRSLDRSVQQISTDTPPVATCATVAGPQERAQRKAGDDEVHVRVELVPELNELVRVLSPAPLLDHDRSELTFLLDQDVDDV